MAQLNDLLVLGKTNFMGETKINSLLNAYGGISLNESTP